MPLTLTLNNPAPATSLSIKDPSDAVRKLVYSDSNWGLFTARAKRHWEDLDTQTTTRLMAGINVRIVAVRNDPDFDVKVRSVEAALESFRGKPAFALPQKKLELYLHVADQVCLGYVLQRPGHMSPIVAIALGWGAVRGNGNPMMPDLVYDYYKPTFSVNAKKKRVLTAVYHEFGHVFHQIHNPSHYYALGQAPLLMHKAQSELTGECAERYSHFTNAPSPAQLQAFVNKINRGVAREVSGYASTHPNEFIAETFAGLMMGVPLSADVVAAYQLLGGVMPAAGMAHVRSGQNWAKKKILYPISKPIFSMGDAAPQ